MGERGEVIKVSGSEVLVRLTRTEACAKCGACAAGLSSEEMIITAENICNAAEHDFVIIELENDNFLLAATIMYGIPLFMLLAGFFTGFFVSKAIGFAYDAPAGFCVGVLFMWLAFEWIRKREKSWKKRGFKPIAVKRL